MSVVEPPPTNPTARILLIVFGVMGLVVCLAGVIPGVGIIAAIAIPQFITMQMKAKRADDGEFAEYTASKSINAHILTGTQVY